MRKQLDPRLQTLIANNVALNHRSFFVLVGDRARDSVVYLHHILSQSRHTSRPNVLWCYKKDLGFTSHRKKREDKIKRDIKRGIREKGDSQDPFELFVGTTEIRYCYYKDTPKILGRTFGMLILQDFEAMTPNMLARTIETVEGGGVVVLMLRTMSSLRQLYSIGMDVHSKYRSAMDPSEPVARFNERFLLSLGANRDTLFLDDELNVLPLSKGKDIELLPEGAASSSKSSRNEMDLKNLKEDIGSEAGVQEVIRCCKTLDQAKALSTILDLLAASSLSSTISLTAARGRGKSALLGLAIAAAVVHGYSNIFVTSPSPENLKTLFEFLFKGLTALGYEEVSDWSLQRGTGDWKDVVVRVNIFRNSRQTIQYIDPSDAQVLGQAEMVVIDEAAAIPLPLVKKLIGPYLVFLSSTINGYEGTGRSLSLKLIQQLRDSTAGAIKTTGDDEESLTVKKGDKGGKLGTSESRPVSATLRSLKELTLNEPIRYSSGDNIESWLNQLLCLDASLSKPAKEGSSSAATPHPSKCDLFLVNRDALFSYHPASELFLQKMMALYVSSHYKNSPNDLQLMSDAPSHRLFVLLATQQTSRLPEPLAVLQVSLEGNIARQSVLSQMSRGERSSGDLIPWTLSQQFQDSDFASLNGVRVVRLAVNPQYAQSGYGSRALECLRKYFAGEMVDEDAIAEREAKALSAGEESFASVAARKSSSSSSGLQSESIALRDAARMPALLQRLSDRRPEAIDWLGASFGLTPQLFRFWKKAKYTPLYIRQVPNDLTGEYTTVMLRSIYERSSGADEDSAASTSASQLPWLSDFARDFRKRFNQLLGFRFREFAAVSALSILEAASNGIIKGGDGSILSNTSQPLTPQELHTLLTPYDLKRLSAFGNNMLDLSIILDLIPILAGLYFSEKIRASDEDGGFEIGNGAVGGGVLPVQSEEELPPLKLSALQSALLLAIGLQRKDPSDVASVELGLPLQQCVALLAKGVRRMLGSLRRVERRGLEASGVFDEASAAAAASSSSSLPGPALNGKKTGSSKALEAELEKAGRKALAKEEKKRAERLAAVQLGEAADEEEDVESDDGDEDEDEDEDDDDEDQSEEDGGGETGDQSSAKHSNTAKDSRDWSEAEKRIAALERLRASGDDAAASQLAGMSTVFSIRNDDPALSSTTNGTQSQGKKDGAATGKKRKGAGGRGSVKSSSGKKSKRR